MNTDVPRRSFQYYCPNIVCVFVTLLVEGICMRNYPEWPIAYIAATSIGCIAVAMNSLWKEREMEYALRDCGAKVLFCDEERWLYARPTLVAYYLICLRFLSIPKIASFGLRCVSCFVFNV